MLNICPASVGHAPVWVDLHEPTPEEVKRVESEYKVRVPSRAQLEEIESSSRLSVENGTIHLNMPVIAHDNEEVPTALGFVFTKVLLVTVRYTPLVSFDTAIARFNKDGPAKSSSEVFATLIEGITDYGADALEQIGVELNGVSQRVFRNYANKRPRNVSRANRALRDVLISVGGCGEKLSQIRESLLGLQRIVPYALDKGKEWISSDIIERLQTAAKDLQSLNDFEVHLSNKVQFLLDAVLGFINTEQNDIFKVLTIVSVVGIPPTLIASMYGMNFRYMPELQWHLGYVWGLGLIAFSAILPTVWFKWRGWW
ncbi:MAG TPA: magnesium transporter CorA family protein [Rhizomicrobium sp.]|jgi:magnesium transporter|nr:magnesium transporter CorA family protein [Rhizomicrobium sp.]